MERYIKIAGGKMRVILCLLVWMLVGAACDSFLDIAPSKKTNIELSKVEHLDALLAAINTTTGNTSLVLSPDITEISTDLYDKTNNGAPFYQHGIAYYLWMNQEVADLSGSGTWSSAYKNIFTANTVLENLSRVTGDEALKADLKAEAHFIRAFQNWELLNTYCLPYSPENMKEPGIPHKTSTSFEQSLVRMNLEESYRFVEEDLKELLACLDTSEQMPQKEESVEEKRHKQSMKDIIIKIVVFIFSPVILIGMLLGLVAADDVSANFGRNVAIASGVFILILIAVIVLSVLYL